MANADRIIELLHEAKARPVGVERERFLDEECRDDAGLREEVVSLLEADTDEGKLGFLKNTRAFRSDFLPIEKPGDRIGRYKLLEQIGEGGCGAVYMAEQDEPVRRRVAVKVIKLGMDTRQVVARFEAERQALALMDHPNIAKVLDAGATETGRPYFVMELVRGVKITQYCDQNHLPTHERLVLFIQVCQAIQHAHQKGVIHRDIKPSNILVTRHDEAAVTKVIDFGIAKATTGQLTDKTVFTAFAQFIGTPAYMSPEQAQMSGLDVDTRADIYSLGVLLYELLTGNTPFETAELLAEGVDAMRRRIREDEPAKPSTRLGTMRAADLTTVAKRRQVEPPRLIHLVRGDLDWLVMKCLEKDRTRRYETASALAMDIQRHLDNEPVVARPPTNLYRFQKLVRRHRLGFATGTAVLLVLLAGIAVSAWQAVRATRAERGQTRLRERAELAERESRNQLYTALVEQARATVRSGEAGHRVLTLDAVRRAAAISNSAELRGAAMAALALPDLRFERDISFTEGAVASLDPGFGRVSIVRGLEATEIRAVPGGRLLASLPPGSKGPAHIAWWSPDGRYLAVKRDHDPDGYHASLEVWSTAEAKQVLMLNDILPDVIDFHPFLPRIVAGRQSGIASVYDLNNGAELSRLELPGTALRIRFSPDGQRLAYGAALPNYNLISIHGAADGALLLSNRWAAQPAEFSWSPGGEWLAVPDWGGQVHLMNGRTGEVHPLGHHKAQAITTLFSPDGAYLFTGGWEWELICWDVRAMRRAFDVTLNSYQIQVRADGGEWAVRTSSGALKFHSFLRPALREFSEDLGAGIERATFSPDGRWLASSSDKCLGLWSTSGGGPGALLEAGAGATAFFHADGKELFLSRDRGCARYRLIEGANADTPPQLIPAPLAGLPGLNSICLASNFVVITSTNQSAILQPGHLDVNPENWAATATGLSQASPDGRWLGICHSYSPLLHIYSLPDLRPSATLNAMSNIGQFQFLRDRDEVAVSAKGAVTLWSTATWKPTRTLTNFRSFLQASDPRFYWLAQDFRVGGLYDARTLQAVLPLPGGTLPLALSPDGGHLAVSVDGHRVQVWDLAEVRARLRELGLDPLL